MGTKERNWGTETKSLTHPYICVDCSNRATNEDARDLSLWRLNSVYSQGIGPCIVPFSLSDLAASFPASSVSRLCRRWVLRVSSNPHPSALQVANPRVSPRLQLSCLASRCSLQVSLNSASSGSSGDGSSSFLESRILQRCIDRISRFPRFLDFQPR